MGLTNELSEHDQARLEQWLLLNDALLADVGYGWTATCAQAVHDLRIPSLTDEHLQEAHKRCRDAGTSLSFSGQEKDYLPVEIPPYWTGEDDARAEARLPLYLRSGETLYHIGRRAMDDNCVIPLIVIRNLAPKLGYRFQRGENPICRRRSP